MPCFHRPISDDEVEKRIERAAAARRADAAIQADPPSDDEVETMLATRRKRTRAGLQVFAQNAAKLFWSQINLCQLRESF